MLDIVDSFARLDIGHPLARVLGVAITNVGLLQALVASQLFRTKPPHPHESADLMRDAVAFVPGR